MKLVKEKIRSVEAEALTSLALIRRSVGDFLVKEKGYREEDIEVDPEFVIVVDGTETRVSVDYVLKVDGRRSMVVKCSPGALESRERHIVSFARVVDEHQIPLAVVTDGYRARVLDVLKGQVIAEVLDAIPDRQQVAGMMGPAAFRAYPEERMEKEKRILLAFEMIKCTEESCE